MSDTNLNDASFTPEIQDSEESTNKQTYSATGSFRFWCQKVLPLVYDDSLSYYELLCKVVNYLNNVIQNVDNLNTSVDNTNTAFDNLQNYVNTTKDTLVEVYGKLEQYVNEYFNNLDVQEEINSKLDAMASDGSLSGIISPFIPSAVSDWLSQHITPTSPAIDASLSVSGAGADAKVTGDRLSELNDRLDNVIDNNAFDLMPLMNRNNASVEGLTYHWNNDGSCTISGTSDNISFVTIYMGNVDNIHLQPGKDYYLKYTSSGNVLFRAYFYTDSTFQTLISDIYAVNDLTFSIPVNCTYTIIRIWVAGGKTINETVHPYLLTAESNETLSIKTLHLAETLSIKTLHLAQAVYNNSEYNDYQSADDISTNAITFVSSLSGQPSITNVPYYPCWLITMNTGNTKFITQIALPFNSTDVPMTRIKKSTWSEWASYINEHDSSAIVNYIATNKYSSCDDIKNNSIYFISSVDGVLEIPDAPFIGWLQTVTTSNNIIMQIIYPYNATDNIKYRAKNIGSGWTSWRNIGSETTDSNGWLQPVDTNTSDETNKTDMTGAIMSMLNDTGYCHLAPGIYYVSGNIDMPADSMIEGCGKQTIIRLLQSTTSGYITRMHTRSTIKNVCFSGSYSPISIADSNIGDRKGINYIGNRDGQDSGVTPATCTCCIVEGCFFENLDSGIYGYNAGGGLQEGLIVNNCYFTRCKAGINFDYWVEYSKITNCVTFQCYYGCINNGGNNVFTACTFHGVIGFLIDNSSDNKTNAAHGTVNGCTFNHIDNMNNPSELGKGYGVKILNITEGFVFSNCQFWYGRVRVENSTGVQITGCEFGGMKDSYPVIETTGNGMVFIDNCLFQTAPTNSLDSPAKFTNCWTYTGDAVNQ